MTEESNSFDSDNEEMTNELNATDKDLVMSRTINKDHFELGNGNIHFLPAKIHYTGFTNVDVYFDPIIKESN
jgi:hypothetical protein